MNPKSLTDKQQIELVRFELKYCERCGRTCLRAAGDDSIYCRRCLPEVEELPEPRRGRNSATIANEPGRYEAGAELQGAIDGGVA